MKRGRSTITQSPWTRGVLAATVALALGSCGKPAMPQWVLWVDTNVPVPNFGDTIRIDLLGANNAVVQTRTAVLSQRSSLPLSFGVLPATDGSPVRIRLQLFTSWRARALASSANANDSSLSRYSIERLVELRDVPTNARAVHVLLAGECLGAAANLNNNTTCVAQPDATGTLRARPDAPASAGIDDGPWGTDTLQDTWQDAIERPCAGTPFPGSLPGRFDDEVCIPGGVFFLGDERRNGISCGPWLCQTYPERLVRVSPFYLDRYETTVARWRAALEAGFEPPTDSWRRHNPNVPYGEQCNFDRSPQDGNLPMTCVTDEAALAFCAFEGRLRGHDRPGERTLPTEAQWEFAASGRGEERLFAWGNDPIRDCAAVAYGRNTTTSDDSRAAAECLQFGRNAQPVDRPTRDLSRDGVHDLSGNIEEYVLDHGERFGTGCWAGTGLLVDPVCETGAPGLVERVRRGGTWYSDPGAIAVATRSAAMANSLPPTGSFRCARNQVRR